ncbi:GNAT family N-acetyltransferase [soil metagenome]
MPHITYHKATLNDIQTLVDNRILFALELSGAQSQTAIDSLKLQMTGYFSKAIAEHTCISFIAECGNEIGGIGSLMVREQPGNFKNHSGKWGYIMNMYTVPEFRRKGICKGILNALVEDGRKSGITAFEMHATKEGELVYAQNGFEIFKEPTYRKYLY